MPFSEFEARIRDELDRMLGAGGFSSGRDIAAITVNRWPHGYGYVENSLFDGDDYEKTIARARQTVGRVAIANSDAGGDAYAHLAIDQAARAVRELTRMTTNGNRNEEFMTAIVNACLRPLLGALFLLGVSSCPRARKIFRSTRRCCSKPGRCPVRGASR